MLPSNASAAPPPADALAPPQIPPPCTGGLVFSINLRVVVRVLLAHDEEEAQPEWAEMPRAGRTIAITAPRASSDRMPASRCCSLILELPLIARTNARQQRILAPALTSSPLVLDFRSAPRQDRFLELRVACLAWGHRRLCDQQPARRRQLYARGCKGSHEHHRARWFACRVDGLMSASRDLMIAALASIACVQIASAASPRTKSRGTCRIACRTTTRTRCVRRGTPV